MTINNHLLANSHLNHIPIKILICPSVTGINRPGIPLRKHSGITIHDTGNSAKGADAVAHAAYVARVERGEGGHQASYHFCVDDRTIVQILPLNEVAWHAGDGEKGFGNNETIAIEICVNSDGDLSKAEDNAMRLAALLMNHYQLPKLYKHQDHSGKYCPYSLLYSGRWTSFVNGVSHYRAKLPTKNKQGIAIHYTQERFLPQATALAIALQGKLMDGKVGVGEDYSRFERVYYIGQSRTSASAYTTDFVLADGEVEIWELVWKIIR